MTGLLSWEIGCSVFTDDFKECPWRWDGAKANSKSSGAEPVIFPSLPGTRFIGVTESSPDHSSMTRIHQRLPYEVHEEVFRFVLKLADQQGLLVGKTVGVDATSRDTSEDWQGYLRRLAELSP